MKKLPQYKTENIILLEKPTNKIRYIKHPADYWYQKNLDQKCHDRVLRLTRGIYVMEEWWRKCMD